MLFIDYSSAFNTIVPEQVGLQTPGPGSQRLSVHVHQRQTVRLGPHLSSSLSLSIGAPQGCVLSPLLYSLYTSDCIAAHPSNTVIKFADDTTVMGLITNSNETANRDEVCGLTRWLYILYSVFCCFYAASALIMFFTLIFNLLNACMYSVL